MQVKQGFGKGFDNKHVPVGHQIWLKILPLVDNFFFSQLFFMLFDQQLLPHLRAFEFLLKKDFVQIPTLCLNTPSHMGFTFIGTLELLWYLLNFIKLLKLFITQYWSKFTPFISMGGVNNSLIYSNKDLDEHECSTSCCKRNYKHLQNWNTLSIDLHPMQSVTTAIITND